MSLADKRAAVVKLHEQHEAVDASPWHPAHPAMKAKMDAGEQKLTDRIIGLQCDDRIYVVGECVEKAMDAAEQFVTRCEKADPDSLSLQDRRSLSGCKRLKVQGDRLEFDGKRWNDFMHALGALSMQAVLTDGGDDAESD